MRAMIKGMRAQQLYMPNNPMYHRAMETLRAAMQAVWANADEIVLTVTEGEIRWEGVTVLAESERSADSLPWLFFKDGVRELRLARGFEDGEAVQFLQILQRLRHASPDEDDLLTLLWQSDFQFLRYRYIDLGVDNAPPVDGIATEQRPGTVPVVSDTAEEQLDGAPRAGIVSLEDFDSTLYFLEEREIEYLRTEVAKEYVSDLRRNVTAMLLDVFEQQPRRDVRDEVLGIIDSFLVNLLSAAQFSAVAHVLREATVAATRARDLESQHRDRLLTLSDRLSEPAALSQLLQSLDEAVELPPQEELNELFEQLRGTALGTLFSWLGRTEDIRLRGLLESAAVRIASSNTAELVRLVGSSDRLIATEAMRRAGALRTAAGVAPLSKSLADSDPAIRLTAAQALGEIGSPGALQALEKALDDTERDVRITSVRAIAARTHRAALPRLEVAVKGKAIREADLTERMAVFEAYGALCGEPGVALLDGLLHSRGGFLSRGEDPELRACAAMALGHVGGTRAQDSLKRAANDKEPLVRNAVNRALRGGR